MLNNILPDYGKDNSEVDNTQITTTTILYQSVQESEEFKSLAKRGMMIEFPTSYSQQNLSDFLLFLLRKHYAEYKVKSNSI